MCLKHLNVVVNQFWKRWRREYLLELRNAHRYHGGNPKAVPPSVGDIVLVEDEDKPRCLWRLAKVTELITGRDGYTRGAILHVPATKTTLQRPLQHLFPLEMKVQTTTVPPAETSDDDLEPTHTDDHESSEPDQTEDSVPVRPRREAATEARNRLAACAIAEEM